MASLDGRSKRMSPCPDAGVEAQSTSNPSDIWEDPSLVKKHRVAEACFTEHVLCTVTGCQDWLLDISQNWPVCFDQTVVGEWDMPAGNWEIGRPGMVCCDTTSSFQQMAPLSSFQPYDGWMGLSQAGGS